MSRTPGGGDSEECLEMNRFAKSEFLRREGAAKEELCRELGQVLTGRLKAGGEFHSAAQGLVSELRLLGHDLWSYDEENDYEIWCSDWSKPTGPGIIVTFMLGEVEVEWSEG